MTKNMYCYAFTFDSIYLLRYKANVIDTRETPNKTQVYVSKQPHRFFAEDDCFGFFSKKVVYM